MFSYEDLQLTIKTTLELDRIDRETKTVSRLVRQSVAMPLPPALLARLSKRGIVTAESEAKRRRQEEEEQRQKEPEEEIIAEGMSELLQPQ